jgi:predicted nuclease with TOPRIM domain
LKLVLLLNDEDILHVLIIAILFLFYRSEDQKTNNKTENTKMGPEIRGILQLSLIDKMSLLYGSDFPFVNFCFFQAQTFNENTIQNLDQLTDLQKQVNEKRKELDDLKSELRSLKRKIEEKQNLLKHLSDEITKRQNASSYATSKSYSDFISIPTEPQKPKSKRISLALHKSKEKERQIKQNLMKSKSQSPPTTKSSASVSKIYFLI